MDRQILGINGLVTNKLFEILKPNSVPRGYNRIASLYPETAYLHLEHNNAFSISQHKFYLFKDVLCEAFRANQPLQGAEN